jgi:hypothetical protein
MSEIVTVAAALVTAALMLAALLRARRIRRARRALFVVVGSAPVAVGGRSLPLPLLLMIAAVIVGVALLAARILALPALLGAPFLVILGATILLFLIFALTRPIRPYVIEVNVARTLRADRFVPFLPPGADDSHETLARELQRIASSLRASVLFVALPHHPAWWAAVAHALEVLAKLPISRFALLPWSPRVREILGQDTFLEALVAAGYAVVLFTPSREVVAALSAVEELDRLYQLSVLAYESSVLVPLMEEGEPLWDVDERGARLIVECGPEERHSRVAGLGTFREYVRGAHRMTLLVYPLEAVLGGGSPLSLIPGLRGGASE